MEGTIFGIRSIALTLMLGHDEYGNGERRALWDTPLSHAPALIAKLLDGDWRPGTFLNINFPDSKPEDIMASPSPAKGSAIKHFSTSKAVPILGARRIFGLDLGGASRRSWLAPISQPLRQQKFLSRR